MKQLYEIPLIEIMKFDGEDVICNSTITTDDFTPKQEGSTDFGEWP